MTDYSITKLYILDQKLIQLPSDIDKYTNLQELICYQNQLTSINNLPHNLQELYCSCNKLTSLDNLPLNLQKLNCGNNPLIYDFKPTLKKIKNYNATRKLSS